MATCEIRNTTRACSGLRPAIQLPYAPGVMRHSSFVILLCLSVTANGQAPKEEREAGPLQQGAVEKPDEPRGGKKLPAWSVEREAEAITFVQQHQPELARLLVYLRKRDPRQYQRAVRELVRTAERLAQTKQRDARRYELELQLWKTRSRIDLLAAQWQMHPSDELRERLRAAVTQQLAQQKDLLLSERERIAQRLEKLDAQLQTLETQQETEIERRMQALTDARRKQRAAPPAKRNPDTNDDKR